MNSPKIFLSVAWKHKITGKTPVKMTKWIPIVANAQFAVQYSAHVYISLLMLSN